MPGPAFLRGESVALHTVETADIDFVREHGTDPRIRHGLTTTEPRNRHAAEQAHERHSESDDSVGLLVCTREGTERVGHVVLFGIDDVHGHGQLACWVTPDRQGEGFATEATELMVDYALCERRLHKVSARAIVPNEGSQRVFEKLGMTEEGRQRDQKFVDGEFVDVYRYAVLDDEWDRRYPQAD